MKNLKIILNFLLFPLLFLTIFSTLSMADDLCYEDPYTDSSGFMTTKNVIPIRDISDDGNLSDVKIIYAIEGFTFPSSFMSMETIGIDGNTYTRAVDGDDAERNGAINVSFGNGLDFFSAFNQGYNYYLHDMEYNDVHETWVSDFFFIQFMNDFFSDTRLFAEYTKDGVHYHVILNPCPGNTISVPTVAVQDAAIDSPKLPEPMTFDVNLTGSLSSEIGTVSYIHYYTVDGTAEAGVDYVAVDDTLEVPAGATSAEINVTISANSSGKFYLILDNAYGATITDGNATGSIWRDFELCYDNSISNDDDCTDVGDFFFGKKNSNPGCLSEADIVNMNCETLSDITIKKLYDEDATDGTCTSGSCNGTNPTTTVVESAYPDYGAGYAYTGITLAGDANTTITDANTHTQTASGSIDNIMLFGSYDKDGLHYEDKLKNCSGSGIDITNFKAEVDVVDDYSYSDPTYTPWIKTKVSMKDGYKLKAVYLGTGDTATGTPQTYAPAYAANPNKSSSITVLMKLVDLNGSTCANATDVDLYTTLGGNDPVVTIIDAGETSDLTNSFVMAYSPDQLIALSKKDIRMQYKAIDFNALLDFSGVKCATRSSSGGVVEGIPACLITNSPNNSQPGEDYKTVFGQIAFDRCYNDNGEPCYASNGGVGAEPYDHDYGCFECSLGAMPYSCSQDNFAIRPDHFDINNTTDTDFPNLLRAGEDYNMSVLARDFAVTTATSQDYNRTKSNLDLNQTRYFADGTIASGTQLHGTLVWSAWDFNITNGTSHQGSTLTPTEVAGVQYNDVGKINISIEDREWAAVDINNANDPTLHDCSPDGAYACGDKNITYIPHHFSFAELSITNHAGPNSNFTYIADNRGMPTTTPPTRSPMAARIHTQIKALTKDGSITQNFRTEVTSTPYNPTLYYENDVNITMEIIVPSTGTNKYLYPDANESNVTNSYIGFGRTGLDNNGTRNINWDESNFPLEFNFQRKINEPANPFDVNGSYLKSIKIVSHYVDPEDGDTDEINGSRISESSTTAEKTACAADEGCVEQNAVANATFYYGRTRSSKFFYEDILGLSVQTPIAIDVYCDLGFTQCDEYGIDTVNGQINEAKWWLSWDHDMDRNDGNVTIEIGSITEGSGTPKLAKGGTETDSVNIDITDDQGVDEDVSVVANATPAQRPMTVPIELVNNIDTASAYYTATPPYTNGWLIYNKYTDSTVQALPIPFYKVRFINTSGWTGIGETGHILETNASSRKTKRLNW